MNVILVFASQDPNTMNESSIIKPVGIMPNNLDLREITFTNLLLLDFNPEKMESKYRVVFNR